MSTAQTCWGLNASNWYEVLLKEVSDDTHNAIVPNVAEVVASFKVSDKPEVLSDIFLKETADEELLPV